MPFMLRISIEALPLTVLLPAFWVALVILIAAAAIAWRRRGKEQGQPLLISAPRWRLELGALLPLPLTMLWLGLYFWPPSTVAHFPYEARILGVVDVLGAVQLALAGWLVWRHRRRLLPTTVTAALAIWWTAGAFLTASMAITGTWL
jgi:hypothetical protein